MIKQALINGGGYLGGAAANAIGAPAASGAMSKMGRDVGARISKLIGSGDYEFNTVAVNTLVKPKGADPNSAFGLDGVMPVRLRHREYLGDIATSSVAGDFSNNVFHLNPGLPSTFPYLSQIAQNFDQYIFHGLVFEFVSSSAASTTGAMGSIIIAADYNPTATAYQSKAQMENSGYAVSTRLDGNIVYGVECAKFENPANGYFVRSGGTTELLNTDLGTVQVATAPSAAYPVNSIVGELWVTYDVELKRPSINQLKTGFAHYTRSNYTSATNPLGTASVIARGAGALYNFSVTGGFLRFNNVNTGDIFRVTVTWSGATSAVLAYPATTLTGCTTIANVYGGIAATAVTPAAGTTSTAGQWEAYIMVTAIDPQPVNIQFGTGGTLPGGGSQNVEVFVHAIGNGLLQADL